ncbi:MAG: type II toxin-antitoxin system VapC family toxin [Nanoarchaeota archaeon]|nr:type II toxin-antitoxin system VapC family toxin [Nanoarchaeota archaeon]MBU1975300.1 type II toxin-antitoxin system VapC family toxin [Nanoarchaeota archaeon]
MIGLDTDFIVDLLKNNKTAIKKYEEIEHDKLVSTTINVHEAFSGVYLKHIIGKRDEQKTRDFFNNLHIFQFDSHAAVVSAKFGAELVKVGSTLANEDCMIACTLITNGCNKLVTRNKKHFSRIKELKVITY